MIKRLLLLGALAVLVACTSTYGTPITEAQIAGLKQGVTTKQELLATFGKPVAKSRQSDGTEILSWAYSKVGVGVYKNSTLTATLDAQGKLQSYTVGDVGG
jgi:outer membrane protein assembly factor BamE (lipoprotein component of BamABCDE complex)